MLHNWFKFCSNEFPNQHSERDRWAWTGVELFERRILVSTKWWICYWDCQLQSHNLFLLRGFNICFIINAIIWSMLYDIAHTVWFKLFTDIENSLKKIKILIPILYTMHLPYRNPIQDRDCYIYTHTKQDCPHVHLCNLSCALSVFWNRPVAKKKSIEDIMSVL